MKTRFTLTLLFSFSLSFILLLSSGKLQAQAPAFGWAHVTGSTGTDGGNRVTVDGAGNSYIVGNFQGTVDFDPGPGTFNLSTGTTNVYILKLNAAGNLVWAKSFGGTGTSTAAIVVDASGNVYVFGIFSSPTADFDPGPGTYNLNNVGNSDIYLLKLDASGNFVSAFSWGGTGGEQSLDFKVDGAGNMYLTGSFSTTVDFDPGPGTANLTAAGAGDIFVLKLDASGNFAWVRGIGNTGNDIGSALAVDASGNVHVAGTFVGTVDFDPGAGTFDLVGPAGDIFILKLDATGNFVWAGRIGGTLTENPYSLKTDASGNVYLGGSFGGTAFDFDPGPGTYNVSAGVNEDGFVLKLDAAGNLVWVRTFGANFGERVRSVEVDASGNVYAIGTFGFTVDFDPGPGTASMTSAGLTDIFFVKLDAGGNYLWSVSDGGAANDFLNQGTVDAAGNLYATGYFNTNTSFGGTNYTPAGGNDIFMVKFGDFATLPLHLLSFNAVKENGAVQLKWTGTNEENVSHFVIERSQDGNRFMSLAKVAARNHSSAEYHYSDLASFSSTIYYRLKITDLDGAHTYSPVRAVKASRYNAFVQLSPVPTKNILTITTSGLPPATGRIFIQVFNSNGQLVTTRSMQAGNVQSMDISTLDNGNYFIRLSGAGNYQSTHQFLKQ